MEDGSSTSAHDLTFATAFLTSVLFLSVKATRPMTYQYLTTDMVSSLPERGGIIDSTMFKTAVSYSFDSLLISSDVMKILTSYTTYIRPQLNPQCHYLLVSRNGTQLKKLGDIFGRMVFQAIGRYIHPTRYRQIVETESSKSLSPDEQNQLSLDQKHSSRVARVHYRKLESQQVAINGQKCMSKLLSQSNAQSNETENIHLEIEKVPKTSDSTKLIEQTQLMMSNASSSSLNRTEMPNVSVVVKDIAEKSSVRKRVSQVPFTKLEDNYLIDAVKKHGNSWTRIIRDQSFQFNPSRKTSTLLQRAKVLGIIER